MRKVTFVLGFLVAFGALVPTAAAVDFATPELGSTTVTITEAALPEPLGSKFMASGPAVICLDGLKQGSPKFDDVTRYIRTSVAIIAYGLDSKSYSVTTWSTYMSDSVPFDITINPITESSILFAVDLWTGEYKAWAYTGKADPNPSFNVVGFEAGADSIEINNLSEGARLWSLHMSMGHQPIATWITEGSWQDADEEVNGVMVTDVVRNTGPPHVLPGDVWVLALEGDTGGAGLWAATGDTVRYTVPVASHVIGSSGTPFISDLSISNPFGLTNDGWIRFVEEGQSWSQAAEVDFSLDPGETISWTDVLDTAFGITDNVKGTLQVGGFPRWSLKVTSRNYAVSEGQQFGIAIPGFATFEPMTPGSGLWIIPGLMENSQFRSNFIAGSAVPQASQITIRLIVDGAVLAERTRSVPGYGLLQINRIASSMGVGSVNGGYLEIRVSSGAVFAALSVVDGSADDAAYITAEPLLQ